MDFTTGGQTRPKTIRERCAQAEGKYQELFTKFLTHNFLDWNSSTSEAESDYSTSVPPYCYWFDEFLGYWLSHCLTEDVPAIMAKYFSEPDEMDCDYLEEVLVELDKVGRASQEPYITWKGSNIYIGPVSSPYYAENIARAQQWVREVKENLALEKMLWSNATLRKSTLFSSAKSPILPKRTVTLASFFQNGFTIEKFDSLLKSLYILNDSREFTIDSKPRIWVSVIKALLDEKLLIHSSMSALHHALNHEYNNQPGLPKVRTMQIGYNADNAQARDCYYQAIALLRQS
jgi:hypothetical protein